MSARLVSASLFGNRCWAGSKNEDDVSHRQVTLSLYARHQPSQLGKVHSYTHLLWLLQQYERAIQLMDVTMRCGRAVGWFFPVLWSSCRADTRNRLPFEAKTDVLGYQS